MNTLEVEAENLALTAIADVFEDQFSAEIVHRKPSMLSVKLNGLVFTVFITTERKSECDGNWNGRLSIEISNSRGRVIRVRPKVDQISSLMPKIVEAIKARIDLEQSFSKAPSLRLVKR